MHTMDADEMLARALQEEEMAAERQLSQRQGPDAQKAALLGLIQDGLHKALSVEDPALMARARAALPIETIRQEAQQAADLNAQLGAQQQQGSIGVDDLLVQGLLRFFKRQLFSWVDQPSCALCTGPTSMMGMAAATPSEAADGAGRVEVYRCSVCQQLTRFPRYTNPGKLLETRKGRCGEWAHTFLLVLRAAGLDARHVLDNADHVWCEYYSTSLDRWVHVDACEEAWDTPLLYEGGWGKNLSYVFAASRHGVADVTRRYVLKPQVLHTRRTQVPEAWLASTLAQITTSRRAALDVANRRLLGLRDAAEALQLMSLEDGAADAPAAAAAGANLPGRQSGSEAWRSARGETGAAPQAKPPTVYCPAQDSSLPALFSSAGRITGGVCRASGENRAGQPSQQVQRLFDGSLSSKWLDFGGGGAAGTAWAEYRLLPNQAPCAVSHYDILSAEDCPERDPCDWVLECIPVDHATAEEGSRSLGSSSLGIGGSSNSSSVGGWIVVDQQQRQCFSRRHQQRSFIVPAASRMLSRQWRLRVTCTADPVTANSVQLACWNLYSSSNHHTLHDAEHPGPQATSGLVGQSTDLYLHARLTAQLAKLFGSADAAAGAAEAANGHDKEASSSAADTAAVATMRRVLTNMQQHPGVAKYWQVSCTAAKLQPVLQDPLLLSVLFECGFRPVLALPTGAPHGAAASAGQEVQQLRLMADETCEHNREVIKSLAALW